MKLGGVRESDNVQDRRGSPAKKGAVALSGTTVLIVLVLAVVFFCMTRCCGDQCDVTAPGLPPWRRYGAQRFGQGRNVTSRCTRGNNRYGRTRVPQCP